MGQLNCLSIAFNQPHLRHRGQKIQPTPSKQSQSKAMFISFVRFSPSVHAHHSIWDWLARRILHLVYSFNVSLSLHLSLYIYIYIYIYISIYIYIYISISLSISISHSLIHRWSRIFCDWTKLIKLRITISTV